MSITAFIVINAATFKNQWLGCFLLDFKEDRESELKSEVLFKRFLVEN